MTVERKAARKRAWYLMRAHYSEETLIKKDIPNKRAREFYRSFFNIDPLVAYFGFRAETPPLISFGYGDGINTQFYLIQYQDWGELVKKLKDYGPRHVFYDRNFYSDLRGYEKYRERKRPNDPPLALPISDPLAHELAFDLDPDNYDCENCGPAEERFIEVSCPSCLQKCLEDTIRLCDFLEQEKYKAILPVATGRGFHVHVQDEQVLSWDTTQRENLTNRVQEEGITIDSFVTTGEMFLIRMPHSWHGGVGKVVTPLSVAELRSFRIED